MQIFMKGMVDLSNDQLVIKGDLARKLLKHGYTIKDLKPKRNEDGTYDFTRSIFVFQWKEGLLEAIESLK
jgi:hypothetical protein